MKEAGGKGPSRPARCTELSPLDVGEVRAFPS